MGGTNRRFTRRAGILAVGLLGVGTSLVLGPVGGYSTVAAAQTAPPGAAPSDLPVVEQDPTVQPLPVEAELPADPDLGVAVSGAGEATDFTLELPLPEGSDTIEQADDRAVYDASGEEWTLVVEQLDATTLRAVMHIDGPAAPTSFPFDLAVAGGAQLLPQPDGTVAVLDAEGDVSLTVQPPWAVDASGASIPTHFTVDGATLIQHVEHVGAAYPVQADPEFTSGIVTKTIYFNRDETARVSRDAKWVGAAVVLGCAVGGGPAAPVCAAVGGVQMAHIQARAALFHSQGDCIKLKVPGAVPYRLEAGTRNCLLK